MKTPNLSDLIAAGNFTQGVQQINLATIPPVHAGAAVRLNWVLAQPPSPNTAIYLERERIRLQLALKGLVPKPKRGQILYNLGCIALHQHRFQDAKLLFSQTLKLLPGHSPSYCNLGYANERTHAFEAARSCYEKAGALDATAILPRLNLVFLLQSQGSPKVAMQALEALYRANLGNQGIMLHLCRFLVRRALPKDFMRVIELTQKNPLATVPIQMLECLALSLSRLGKLHAAQRVFEAILNRQKNNRFAHTGLVRVRTLLSQSDAASFHGRRQVDQLLKTGFEQASTLEQVVRLIPKDKAHLSKNLVQKAKAWFHPKKASTLSSLPLFLLPLITSGCLP